jgi:hypothetical protein
MRREDKRRLPVHRETSMPHIIVDDEQARIISESSDRVEIRDRNGKHLGYVFSGFSEVDIALAKQRRDSDEPRYSTQDVLKHLQSLAPQ